MQVLGQQQNQSPTQDPAGLPTAAPKSEVITITPLLARAGRWVLHSKALLHAQQVQWHLSNLVAPSMARTWHMCQASLAQKGKQVNSFLQ